MDDIFGVINLANLINPGIHEDLLKRCFTETTIGGESYYVLNKEAELDILKAIQQFK